MIISSSKLSGFFFRFCDLYKIPINKINIFTLAEYSSIYLGLFFNEFASVKFSILV
jgi:hypothetical protein